MKVIVFSEGKKKPMRFSMKERIVEEDGVTTIRPYRNGSPGATNKELEKCFAEFEAALIPDAQWPVDSQVPKTRVTMRDSVTLEEFEIDFGGY